MLGPGISAIYNETRSNTVLRPYWGNMFSPIQQTFSYGGIYLAYEEEENISGKKFPFRTV